jgi:hypothetical protein
MAATIPNEPEARLQYNTDKVAAAVVIQTFHYMVENGSEFRRVSDPKTVISAPRFRKA